MKIENFIKPWHGTAVRHIPDGNNVLDFSLCGLANENRWNSSGEPTLYLAGSKQIALGEYSRHYQGDRSSKLYKRTQRRSLWKLELRLKKTIDLCNPGIFSAFPNSPHCFKEIKSARAIATFFRDVHKVEAIFVPSLVFLDDLTKWCLVLFLENLPQETSRYIIKEQKDGLFEIS